jgi:hypothetical protein
MTTITWRDERPFYVQHNAVNEPIYRWYLCLAVIDGKQRLAVIREHNSEIFGEKEEVLLIDSDWIMRKTEDEHYNFIVSLVLRLTELVEILFFS